jgi:hypothetical protein
VTPKLEPASAIVRKTRPRNDNRPDVLPQTKPAAIMRTAQPPRAMHKMPEDKPKPAPRARLPSAFAAAACSGSAW